MDDLIFNKEKRLLNKAYYDTFGVIPCLQNYDCSREEYIEALKTAIANKTEIDKLLPLAGKPIDNDSII